jgi:hypothetical protein
MNETEGNAKQGLQREQLIVALMREPRLKKAAASIGISYSTAWRIYRTPEFQQGYCEARRVAFSQSLRRLQKAANAAVTTLLTIMIDPKAPPASRLRAAELVLEDAERSLDREDLEMRVQRLEERATKLESWGNGNGSIPNQ